MSGDNAWSENSDAAETPAEPLPGEAARPDAARPEAALPDVARPEAALPDAALPLVVLPEGMKVIPARTVDALFAAHRVLARAQQIARKRVESAETEATQLREEARRAGWLQGLGEGMAALAAGLTQAQAALHDAATQKEAMVDVLMQALETVLGPRAHDDDWGRARFVRFVTQGLSVVYRRAGRICIRVHPRQAPVLEGAIATWAKACPGCDITLQPAGDLRWDSYRIEGGTEENRWWISDVLPDAAEALKAVVREVG